MRGERRESPHKALLLRQPQTPLQSSALPHVSIGPQTWQSPETPQYQASLAQAHRWTRHCQLALHADSRPSKCLAQQTGFSKCLAQTGFSQPGASEAVALQFIAAAADAAEEQGRVRRGQQRAEPSPRLKSARCRSSCACDIMRFAPLIYNTMLHGRRQCNIVLFNTIRYTIHVQTTESLG